jgi:hypothetical protein
MQGAALVGDDIILLNSSQWLLGTGIRGFGGEG